MSAATIRMINKAYFRCLFKTFVSIKPISVSNPITMGISNMQPPINIKAPKKEMYLAIVILGVATP